MGAQPLSKKRGLMKRLRQVRTAAMPTSTRICSSGDDEKPTIHAPTHAEMNPSHPVVSDEGPRRRLSKGHRPVHSEGALDVEKLNTKLAHYALTSEHPRGNAGRDLLEPLANAESASQASERIAPHLQPPDQAEEPGPSDYETFMREAEEDDRLRATESREHGAPGRSREPALNSFYSNNWAARSEPTEKLAEIQESDEEEDEGSTGESTPTDSGVGPAQSRSGGTDANRDDAARFSLPRAQTEPCGQGGRHIQFRNTGEAGERMGGRRGSGASCAQRLKSPPRPVRRQRSMMKVIADYIRLPRD